MGLIDFLQANWAAVMTAPWVFVTLAVLFGGGGWVAGRFIYRERIETLKSRIEARDEKIAAYEARLVEKEKPTTKQQPTEPAPALTNVVNSLLEPPTMKLSPVKNVDAIVGEKEDALDVPTVKLTPSQVAKTPTTPTQVVEKKPESPQDILIRRRWTFYFSPKGNNGQKNMTFLPHGIIGEGRNDNEYRWEFLGRDVMVIYRRNGDVQNTFRYTANSGRFEYLPDSRAVGFTHQYLQPR